MACPLPILTNPVDEVGGACCDCPDCPGNVTGACCEVRPDPAGTNAALNCSDRRRSPVLNCPLTKLVLNKGFCGCGTAPPRTCEGMGVGAGCWLGWAPAKLILTRDGNCPLAKSGFGDGVVGWKISMNFIILIATNPLPSKNLPVMEVVVELY